MEKRSQRRAFFIREHPCSSVAKLPFSDSASGKAIRGSFILNLIIGIRRNIRIVSGQNFLRLWPELKDTESKIAKRSLKCPSG
jgi:hypothetical protein